jgi:hypothetical protein
MLSSLIFFYYPRFLTRFLYQNWRLTGNSPHTARTKAAKLSYGPADRQFPLACALVFLRIKRDIENYYVL